MDLTFQVPVQYCSLQHRALLPSPVPSTTGHCFLFGSISSFFLELFLYSSPVAYYPPTNLRSSSFMSYHFAFSYCSIYNIYIKYIFNESESCSVVSDSLQPHGLYSPWNSPGQNTGVDSPSLLQGIFPSEGSNPGLLHCRQILYQLRHKRSPYVCIIMKLHIFKIMYLYIMLLFSHV